MDRHMDDSCKQRVYCLHRSFVIVHTEHGQWQASFTQGKLACFAEVSVMKHIYLHAQEPGNKASSCRDLVG